MSASRIYASGMDALHAFALTASNSSNQDEIFRAAQVATQAVIGHDLFTIMTFDRDRLEVERRFSSDPASYPVGGRKKKQDTEWGRRVLERGEVFIGGGEDDIRRYFDDHELILGLGLRTVLNVPVKRLGNTIGTMNLLRRDRRYDEGDAAAGTLIAMGLVGALGSTTCPP